MALLGHPIVGYLLNIMYQTIQQPLHININFATVGKAVHTFVITDIAKDRLHITNALAINLFAMWGIDF